MERLIIAQPIQVGDMLAIEQHPTGGNGREPFTLE
jgi:hypothetical protein